MTKRITLLACVVAALLAPGFAHADGDAPKVFTGTITVGDPMTAVTGGVTETLSDCTSSDPTDGLDGQFFDVTDYEGLPAVLDGEEGDLGINDFDVYFYDSCGSLMDDYSMANNALLGDAQQTDEHGVIPDGAAYAVVDLFTGANASFTLTVG